MSFIFFQRQVRGSIGSKQTPSWLHQREKFFFYCQQSILNWEQLGYGQQKCLGAQLDAVTVALYSRCLYLILLYIKIVLKYICLRTAAIRTTTINQLHTKPWHLGRLSQNGGHHIFSWFLIVCYFKSNWNWWHLTNDLTNYGDTSILICQCQMFLVHFILIHFTCCGQKW